MEHLGVEPGSVTPFALLNDQENKVNLAIEEKVLASEKANFHPLINTATLTITSAGLRQFLTSTGHQPIEINCD